MEKKRKFHLYEKCIACRHIMKYKDASYVSFPIMKNGEESSEERPICPDLRCLDKANELIVEAQARIRGVEATETMVDGLWVSKIKDPGMHPAQIEVRMRGWKPSEVPDFWKFFEQK